MGVGAAIAGTAVVGSVASLASSANSASAAKSAAATEANASNNAAAQQLAEFNQIRNDLGPYRSVGEGAAPQLASLTGTGPGGNPLTAPLTAPFTPTLAQLQSTPGYQFTLNQGLQATQNSYAAQGLGQSGAALKGAANYAEGLAGTTYQQQFGNYLAQNQQIYNMLTGETNLGETAATQTGQLGTQNVSAANALSTGGAAASAAGTVGAANALAAGGAGLASSANNASLLLSLQNQGLYGGGSGTGGVNYIGGTPPQSADSVFGGLTNEAPVGFDS